MGVGLQVFGENGGLLLDASIQHTCPSRKKTLVFYQGASIFYTRYAYARNYTGCKYNYMERTVD